MSKKDGNNILCVDFRKLNTVTVDDPCHLPHSEEFINDTGMVEYITTLDLTKGHHQVPVSKNNQESKGYTWTLGKVGPDSAEFQFVVEHRAGTANATTDGLSWEPWIPKKGKGMSEIKEMIDKKTSLTGTAAHLQQELSVREQSCGKNGCGNVVGGLKVNRTNDHTNGKHVDKKNSPDSQDSSQGTIEVTSNWNLELLQKL